MNGLKTVLLMGLLTGLFLGIGHLIGGRQGMYIALGLAAVMNLVSYWFSDKIVLALYRAQPVSEAEAPWLYRVVGRLTQRAGIPMPRLYIIPNPSPNAFATGRNPDHAAVAVTDGILRILTEDELEGVLAHELAHVQHRDVLISAMAATLAGALLILVRIFAYSSLFFGGDGRRRGGGLEALALLIVAPIAAALIQMAISRSREYAADAKSAELTGNPLGLARALAKLRGASEAIPMQADPNTAHLFIVSPLRAGSFLNLFSTHPPLEERIARLERLARGE
ncbi:MAG: protease HtpX [Armatimonadetes bacterium]|nr:protease HtpX [Armatimonadota bacterium]